MNYLQHKKEPKDFFMSIRTKMFLFTFFLISFILSLSFFILYKAMPVYYQEKKWKEFSKETHTLLETLESDDETQIKEVAISLFSLANNATVIAYGEGGDILPKFSSPFQHLEMSVVTNIYENTPDIRDLSNEGRDALEIVGTLNSQVDEGSITGESYAENEAAIKNFSETADTDSVGDTISITIKPGESSIYTTDGYKVESALSLYDINQKELDGTEPIHEGEIAIVNAAPTTDLNDTMIPSIDVANAATLNTVAKDIEYLQFEVDLESPLIDHMLLYTTLQPIDEAGDVILSLIPWILSLDILLSLAITYFYSRQFTQPILSISAATMHMKERKDDPLSNIRTRDELGVLSQNVDELYIQLENMIQKLEVEIEKTEKLEKIKSEFMQGASHELKTPLSVIHGLLEGMIDNIGKYKNRDVYLIEAKKKTEELTLLVEKILNVSAAEVIDKTHSKQEIALKDLLINMLERQSYQIKEKNLTIESDLHPFILEADLQSLELVFSNLIQNAISYTPENETIYLSLLGGQGEATFVIKNKISAEIPFPIEELLEPFRVTNFSRNKYENGTGLGLYIIKNSLDHLEYSFEMEQKNGSFIFTIYLKGCK